MTVFLSHNTRDKDTAREIAMFLVSDDVEVWFDEWQVSAGDSIVEKIEDGLSACSHFIIIVWSANAACSRWVRRELESALGKAIATGVPKVIPVLLDDTSLPSLLSGTRHIRYRGGSEADRSELIDAVTGRPASGSYIKAVVKKYQELIRRPGWSETFELAACPRCGSERIEPGIDWEVDVNSGDHGEPVHSAVEVPLVRCLECGWESRGEGLDLFHRSPGELPNR